MICVLGDVMLDKYSFGKIERISPEAPVPVISVLEEKYALGGAANVANNLISLKEDVYLLGLNNNGSNLGKKVISLCEKSGIKTFFVNDNRPTTLKHRFIARDYNQQVLRADYEDKTPLSYEYSKKLVDKILELNPKILIISDYGKGVITQKLMENLKRGYTGKILVDPKPKNVDLYKDVYLLKPNLNEASNILGEKLKNEDSKLEEAVKELMSKYHSNVLITRGSRGSTLSTLNGNIYHIPAEKREVYDVSGAGDTFLATIAYALNHDYSLLDAVELATRASSIVVGKVGTATVTLDELFNKDE